MSLLYGGAFLEEEEEEEERKTTPEWQPPKLNLKYLHKIQTLKPFICFLF